MRAIHTPFLALFLLSLPACKGDCEATGAEVCDGVDNDCNGKIDDGLETFDQYVDADQDGFGDPETLLNSCEGSGMVTDGTDCDDGDAGINPGMVEVCDGVDEDCNGSVDDGALLTFYPDEDGDGFGDEDAAVQACEADAGQIDEGGDCDDSDLNTWPGAEEICGDGIENDCSDSDRNPCIWEDVLDLGDVSVVISNPEAQWGDALTSGDLTGDGLGDLVTSGPMSDTGDVYVFDLFERGDELEAADAVSHLSGEHETHYLGRHLAVVDDVTGDGTADLLAAGYDAGANTVHLLSGPLASEPVASEGEANIGGLYGWDYVGLDAYDDDGDGLGVVALGDAELAYETGAVYLFAGPVSGQLDVLSDASGTIAGDLPGQQAGYVVANAGDLDGDGAQELAVSLVTDAELSNDEGVVRVFMGAVSGSVAAGDGDLVIRGEDDQEELGAAYGQPLDYNGDGYGDLLVGNPGANHEKGGGVLFLGSAEPATSLVSSDAWLTVNGRSSGNRCGVGLDAADLNGDGNLDIVVGCSDESYVANRNGSLMLFAGPLEGSVGDEQAAMTLRGEGTGDQVGWRVRNLGDSNGDGFDDVAFTALGNQAVYLLLGGSL